MFFQNHTIGKFLLGIFLCISIFYIGVDIAQAVEASPAPAAKELTVGNFQQAVDATSDMRKKISEWASIFVGIFTPLIAVLIKLVSSLMSDEFIFGNNSTGSVAMIDLLYVVWDISRAIVNYLILLALMFIAMMNIVPKFGKEYSLKEYLPKIILAAVLVNLTWFGVRVTMDVASVATHAVYSLPQTIFQELNFGSNNAGGGAEKACTLTPNGKEGTVSVDGLCMVGQIIINPKGNFAVKNTDGAKAIDQYKKDLQDQVQKIQDQIAKATGDSEKINLTGVLTSLNNQLSKLQNTNSELVADYGFITIFWQDFKWEKFNEGTIAPLFAYSVMKIQNLPRIANLKEADKEFNRSVNLVIDNGWVSLMINAVIALLVMIILLVLFVMMLVVLIFRIIIIWVNIMVAPFWAFKQVGLFDIFSKLEGKSEGYIGMDPFIKSVFAPTTMAIPMVVGFILIFAGMQVKIFPSLSEGAILGESLINGVADIHKVFYYVLCIAVMWIGTSAAIKSVASGTFFSGMVDGIASYVSKGVDIVKKAPMYAPIIPTMTADGKPAFTNIQYYNDKLSQDYFGNYQTKLRTELDGPQTIKDSFIKNTFNGDTSASTSFFSEIDSKSDAIKSALSEKPKDNLINILTNNTNLTKDTKDKINSMSPGDLQKLALYIYGKDNIKPDNEIIETEYNKLITRGNFPKLEATKDTTKSAPAAQTAAAPADKPPAAGEAPKPQ